ncbi:MAG TPA: sulfatase-like hydrolase/transferase [Pontiella sp.]
MNTLICIAAIALTYPVVDTGQTTAYGNNKGQDAHYSANPPSYCDNGDGTISDQVTGLMWTKDPGEKMTLSEAERGAKKCRTGGYSDWRLPSVKELYSLIQLNGTDPDPMGTDTTHLKPFIDDSIFNFSYGKEENGERIIDSQFATSTKYVSTTMGGNETMFGVNFADGRIKGYPISSRRGEGRYYVIYVRNNPDYGINQFKDNGDGTITDEATGLTWMKADSGTGMDWPSALEYAENLELAGYSDWRLPNAKELQSIIDYSRSPDTTDSAAIDPIFDCTPIKNEGGDKDFAHYWTSSTHVGERTTDTAVYFAFGRALGWMNDHRSGKKILMDVHGAGAQRSDPKVGDASTFPYGRGPQGDVIRIENMVRCVRGGTLEPSTERPETSLKSPTTSTAEQSKARNFNIDRFFTRFDTNQDGKVSKAEFTGPEKRFNKIDSDKDGLISREEAEKSPSRKNPEPAGDPRPFDSSAVASVSELSPNTSKPNIIFIYADDMGWTGTSIEMIQNNPETKSDFYKTPNLEKLASQGMVFSQAYAPGPMCTPSRVGILTGKTPAEMHITTPGNGKSDSSKQLITPQFSPNLPNIPTIGTMLKREGYTTALFGKWHIGSNDHAGNHGFDAHDGSTGNKTNGTNEDPKEIFSLTERGIQFMTDCVKSGTPFYLQLSHYAVHTPTQSRPESINKFENSIAGKIHNQANYAGMTWDLDESIGQVLQALENLHISDNTYVVFMSDNGAPGNRRKPNNSPLFAGKGSLYEGGIRIPFIINGPDIKTGYCTEAVSGTDLFSTFAAWAGAETEPDESVSLIPLLQNKTDLFKRTHALLFHYPHYGKGPEQKPQTALIVSNWKLLKDWETNTYQLFDLSNDLEEKNDLSKSNEVKLGEMIQLMDQRLSETQAQLPIQNPDYTPPSEY